MARLLPADVAVAEALGDVPDAALLPEEAAVVRHAVDARRREFTAARSLARRALAELGHPPVTILPGAHREPLWPTGIVGSITHSAGYCAAVVARSNVITTIGIDAEIHAALPEGVCALIARDDEREWLRTRRGGAIHWDRLLFSAKESVFKAWFPLMRRWLGFESVRVRFSPASATFRASFVGDRPIIADRAIAAFEGRYLVQRTHVLTAIAIATDLPVVRVLSGRTAPMRIRVLSPPARPDALKRDVDGGSLPDRMEALP